jgi:hypothetical protein
MRLLKLFKKEFNVLLSWLFNVDMGVDSPYWRNQMEFSVMQSKHNDYFDRKQRKLNQKKMLRRQKRLS